MNRLTSYKTILIFLVLTVALFSLTACDRSSATIYFNANGGAPLSSVSIQVGDSFDSLPQTTRTGYDFAGWYFDAALNEPTKGKTVTGSATLYAAWGHTVTFNTDDGEKIQSTVVIDGRALSQPKSPSHPTLTFSGWYLDADFTTVYDFETPVTSDLTLYARFLNIVSDVYTAQDFLSIANNAYGNYTLKNDVDLEGAEITGFFSVSNPFRGTFQGDGYTVSNFTLRSFGGNMGLFCVNEGSISNLNLSAVISTPALSSNINTAGILCGVNKGIISNCSVSASVSAIFGGNVNYFGAICGDLTIDGVISNCESNITLDVLSDATVGYYSALVGSSHGQILSSVATTNGLINVRGGTSYFGSVSGYSDGTLKKCGSYGTQAITVGNATAYIGGLTGASNSGGTGIANCFSTTALNLTTNGNANLYCAGLSATLPGSVLHSFASGNITGDLSACETALVGGFIATVSKNAVVTNCLVLNDVTVDGINATVSGAVAKNEGNSEYLYRYSNQNVYGISNNVGTPVQRTLLTQYDWYAQTLSITDDFPYSQALAAVEQLKVVSTKDNPTIITTAEQFLAIPKHTVEYYKLGADIDFNGAKLTPINFNSDSSGLDGNGHYLSNFVLTNSNEYVGIVGINGGTICNLFLQNFSFSQPENTVAKLTAGSIAAINAGTVTDCSVSDCNVLITVSDYLCLGGACGKNSGLINSTTVSGTYRGNATSAVGNCYVGGITGNNAKEIAQSAFLGSVYSNEYAGGIAAISYGKLYQSFNRGGITAASTDKKALYVGGLVGYTESNSDFTNNYNAGTVSAESITSDVHSGGLIGYAKGAIAYCYSVGAVSGLVKQNKTAYVGGLIGWERGATVSYCYFDGMVSAVCDDESASAYGGAICAKSSGTVSAIYFSQSSTISSPQVYETTKQVKINATFNYEYASQTLKFSKDKWYNGTSSTSLPRLRWEFPSA